MDGPRGRCHGARVSSDTILVQGVRTVLGLSLRFATSVDEAAERVELASERARELTARYLPLARQSEEL